MNRTSQSYWIIILLVGQILVANVAAEESSTPFRVNAVQSVGMTVRDVDRSVAFYRDVLGFEKFTEREVDGPEFERLTGVFGSRARIVRMKLGDEQIELTEYLAPRGRSMPEDSRANDQWFQHIAIIVRDMDEAYQRLRQFKVEHASSGPQRLPDWNKAAGGIQAFYFRDPDGHFLEILQFPLGKGDPKWHRATDKLFLGIDHTAIVTFDTEASLRFYRDSLGMKIVGTSENYGTEQEHLNNVFGARLRITTLRAAAGPGIELLEYLTPRDGRHRPRDTRANDIAHWQTTVSVDDLPQWETWRALPTTIVSLANCKGADGHRLIISDPDGHAIVLLVE
jgi:catechol 2,3-dioxygenase-like lactoylglutathione lyase family enzyme